LTKKVDTGLVFPFPVAGGHIVVHEMVAEYCL